MKKQHAVPKFSSSKKLKKPARPKKNRYHNARLIDAELDGRLPDGTRLRDKGVHKAYHNALLALSQLFHLYRSGVPDADRAFYHCLCRAILVFNLRVDPSGLGPENLHDWPVIWPADFARREAVAQRISKMGLGKKAFPKIARKTTSSPYRGYAYYACFIITDRLLHLSTRPKGRLCHPDDPELEGKDTIALHHHEKRFAKCMAPLRRARSQGLIYTDLDRTQLKEMSKLWWNAAEVYFDLYHPDLASEPEFARLKTSPSVGDDKRARRSFFLQRIRREFMKLFAL